MYTFECEFIRNQLVDTITNSMKKIDSYVFHLNILFMFENDDQLRNKNTNVTIVFLESDDLEPQV